MDERHCDASCSHDEFTSPFWPREWTDGQDSQIMQTLASCARRRGCALEPPQRAGGILPQLPARKWRVADTAKVRTWRATSWAT